MKKSLLPVKPAPLDRNARALAIADSRVDATEALVTCLANLSQSLKGRKTPRSIRELSRHSNVARTIALALQSVSGLDDQRPVVKLNVMATLTPGPPVNS